MNLLLFLGAGFSADAGLPTQDSFFEDVRKPYIRNKLSQWHFAGLTATEQLTLASNDEDIKLTMENAFSMLDYMYYMKPDEYKMGHMFGDIFIPSRNSQLGVTKAREYFLKALESIYGYNRPNCTYINHELYYQFLDELFSTYNVYIITTNYDLVCESVLNKMIGRDPLLFAQVKYYDIVNKYVPVPLLKLHGSIDWKETSYDIPNIIPPTWTKQFNRTGKYNAIWNQAEDAISISDIMLFIGYSMPEMDIHIRTLIKLGLLNSLLNGKDKDVYVVKPNWSREDEKNYGFLKKEATSMKHNYYNIKHFEHIPKTFKQFAKSTFSDVLQANCAREKNGI